MPAVFPFQEASNMITRVVYESMDKISVCFVLHFVLLYFVFFVVKDDISAYVNSKPFHWDSNFYRSNFSKQTIDALF